MLPLKHYVLLSISINPSKPGSPGCDSDPAAHSDRYAYLTSNGPALPSAILGPR